MEESKKKNKIISILLPILLGAGLTYYTFQSFTATQIIEMKSYFANANYNYIYVSLFFAITGYVLRAYRWKYTLEHIGLQSNFKLNFWAVSLGYFVNMSVPRSGEFSRALVLKKYANLPFDKVFGTIIAERIVDFIILLIFIFTAIVVEFSKLKNFLLQYIPISKILILLGIGFLGLLMITYLYKYSKLRIITTIKSKIEGLKEGALSVIEMPHKVPFLIQTVLIWTSYVLMFYFATFSLSATYGIPFATVLVAFVIGSLTIAFTNGGFGFFPVLIAKILVLYSIPLAAGTAFGWIVWTSQLLITVIMGVLAFLFLPLMKQKN